MKRKNRADVFSEITRLREAEARPADRIEELLHELQVQQEEINVQNAQLIAAQEAIEATRDRYIDLFDFAPIGYLTLDAKGTILEVNLAGAALLGAERARVAGMPLLGFVQPDHRKAFIDFVRRCRQGGAPPQPCELALRSHDGATRVQLLGAVNRHAGAQEGFLTAMVDVSEQRRLEHDRRQADEARARATRDREIARASSDAKDRFLATLSHELRTPLNPVLAAVTDPDLTAQTPPNLRPLLAMIRRNVELEVRLIDDLLDVTRIARNRLVLERRDIDVHEAIRDVVGIVEDQSQQRRLRVSLAFEATRSFVHADPTRLRQVLWNLLGNAMKFTAPGGRIAVTTQAAGDDRIEITVSDSGRGMDAETLSELFLPADQRTPRPLPDGAGLGLGLWICRNIVEAHGGTIAAASPGPGLGSTFLVELPVMAAPPAVPAERSEPAERAGLSQPMAILLVEDHKDSADMLSAILRHHGYTVDVAHTFKEAAAKITGRPWDLVISDLNLPDGTGLDLMKAAPAPGVRGIAMSGFGTPDDERRSAAAGYAAHLTKPLDIPRLLRTIARVTGR